MIRLFFFSVLLMVLSFACTASSEPGEEGLDDEQACRLGLENYMGKRLGGWERPCDESNYAFLMDPSNHCSASIKQQATSYRERQCGKSPPPKEPPSQCDAPKAPTVVTDGVRLCLLAENLSRCTWQMQLNVDGKPQGGATLAPGAKSTPGGPNEQCVGRGHRQSFLRWRKI